MRQCHGFSASVTNRCAWTIVHVSKLCSCSAYTSSIAAILGQSYELNAHESCCSSFVLMMTLPTVDFSELNGNGLWRIFQTKAYYGGALAYAVLSRAFKLGCPCKVSLEHGKESRERQREDWLQWCSTLCNLLWSRRIAYETVSTRNSYSKRLCACWSAPAPSSFLSASYSELKLPNNIVARIASLAVHPDSANLLDQVMCCASDERREVIPSLWLKINADFICNASWVPLYRFEFSDGIGIREIDPSMVPNHAISWQSLADAWSQFLPYLRRICGAPLRTVAQLRVQRTHGAEQEVWNHCVCDPAFEIPEAERAVTMWIWLLWSSHSLSPFLNKTLTWRPPAVPAVVSTSDESSTEQRLRLLQDLLAKRLITPAEFKNKRQRVLGSL